MKSKTNIEDIGENIIAIAKKKGCTAQVTIVDKKTKEIKVRRGVVEQLLSSTAFSTGVRLFSGKKSAIISFSGQDFGDMEGKIESALKDVVYLEDDDAKRLLEPGEFAGKPAGLELDDGAYDDVVNSAGTGKAINTLEDIEKKGLAYSDKISPGEMAEFSASFRRVGIFTSPGVHKVYSRSYYSYYYAAVAEDKAKGIKEVDAYSESKRFLQDLEKLDLEKIGEIAAQRALRKVGGRKIPSGEKPVIFSYRISPSLVDLLGDALDGEEVLLRSSFLVDRLGEKLFPDHITIEDNPLIDRYPGSHPFDGEGKNGSVKRVIDKGTVTSFLHNSYSATKLGMELTGNASLSLSSSPGITCGNFFLHPGQGSLDDLVSEMKNGLLVDELFLSGMNSVTGDFSFGCSGFMVENGKVAYPVKEITIAGNLVELFQNINRIADDNPMKYAVSSPSFLVSKLSISGT